MLEEALRHGVLGRIWKQQGDRLRTVFSPSTTRRWRHAMRCLAARNLASCDELLRVVQTLRHEGIRALPVKGPALAVALSGSPCSRDYADVDLLVDRAEATPALEILRAAGYRDAQTGACTAAGDQVALTHPDGTMVLELQWDLGRRWNLRSCAGEPPFVFGELWQRRTAVPFGSAELPSLAGEDQFLLLSVHGARHCWRRLLWVCDAADAVSAWPQMDWDFVFVQAERLRCIRRVCLAFQLSSDVLGAPIPEFAQRRISRDARIPRIARGIVRRWDEPAPPEWRADLSDLGFTLSSLDEWRDRAGLGGRALWAWFRPNGRDHALVALPAWAAPVYYAIRPFRLAWRYGPEAMQAWLGFASRAEEDSGDTAIRF